MRTKPCLSLTDVEEISGGLRGRGPEKQVECGRRHRRRRALICSASSAWTAPRYSAEVAIGKARTSALTKRPEQILRGSGEEPPALAASAGVLIQGALPIMHQMNVSEPSASPARAVA